MTMRLPGDPSPDNLRGDFKMVFVPNADDPHSKDEIIKFRAEITRQDPDTVIVIPFSELEGSISTQLKERGAYLSGQLI